ncbi:MAG TPA: hypothetical protein VFU01_02470 [Gemmatimonadaceae bacterium]|nr:hypothetical protein [Gemmatimonadaceae bacterium]
MRRVFFIVVLPFRLFLPFRLRLARATLDVGIRRFAARSLMVLLELVEQLFALGGTVGIGFVGHLMAP